MKRLMMMITFCVIAVDVSAEGMSKSQWLTLMRSELPSDMCSKEPYFRKCFSISQANCVKQSSNLLRECISINDASIPKTLDTPSFKHWGRELGSCVGEKLEKILESNRIESDECKKSG